MKRCVTACLLATPCSSRRVCDCFSFLFLLTLVLQQKAAGDVVSLGSDEVEGQSVREGDDPHARHGAAGLEEGGAVVLHSHDVHAAPVRRRTCGDLSVTFVRSLLARSRRLFSRR